MNDINKLMYLNMAPVIEQVFKMKIKKNPLPTSPRGSIGE